MSLKRPIIAADDCMTAPASDLPSRVRHRRGFSGGMARDLEQKRQILIAEDDDLIANALKHLLEAKGDYDCLTTRDFAELSRALQGRMIFQAIILDLHMPGMLGFHSVTAIKQMAPGSHILVFTGDDRASEIELFGAGVSGVVFKTSGLAVIKSALAKVLSGRRFIQGRDRPAPRLLATPQATTGPTKIDVQKIRRRFQRSLLEQ